MHLLLLIHSSVLYFKVYATVILVYIFFCEHCRFVFLSCWISLWICYYLNLYFCFFFSVELRFLWMYCYLQLYGSCLIVFFCPIVIKVRGVCVCVCVCGFAFAPGVGATSDHVRGKPPFLCLVVVYSACSVQHLGCCGLRVHIRLLCEFVFVGFFLHSGHVTYWFSIKLFILYLSNVLTQPKRNLWTFLVIL